MSKFNFSFRRTEKKAFRHIAHGLIPAATIAPRPAVPRTPPPRSLSPSPERPRSALAAAILTSSLTGRTVAIPPTRTRSLSESDCSRSEHPHNFQPFASTALYTRDRWSDPVGSRPRCSSPGHSGDDDDDDAEDDGLEEEVLSEDGHVYQSVDNPVRSPAQDVVYAIPHKLRGSRSDGDELTEDSTFDVISPLHTEEEIEEPTGKLRSSPTNTCLPTPTQHRHSSPLQLRTPSPNLPSRHPSKYSSGLPDKHAEVMERSRKQQRRTSPETTRTGSEAGEAYREALEVQKELVRALREQTRGLGGETQALKRRCEEQSQLLQESQERILSLERELSSALRDNSPHAGETVELQSLHQQAQELVDENDALKMTVHRLNVELSHYQTRFRPLSIQERTSGLPVKGPSPPWLLDMKHLSPLLLAYEDRLMEKDTLLQACEEAVRKLRVQTEAVVKENEELHEQIVRMGGVSHKEWKQLQEQARLVLEENEILVEQLEVQHAKAKENHSRHHQEVAKVSKQLVLREDELLRLQGELEETQHELQTLQHQQALSRQQHQSDISQLAQRLEEGEKRWRGETDELMMKIAALQSERKILVRDKTQLDTTMKSLETDLELSRHAHRKAQRRIESLKQQLEESMDKELTALQYLAAVVGLAEKTTLERDQLIHMASVLEKDKQDVITRIIQGTMQLAKIQEKVKVYRREAASSVSGVCRRLAEQEEAFSSQTESFLRERQHLQRLLRDKQEALDGALHQKREVEFELEAVWESVSREGQRTRDDALESPTLGLLVAPSDAPSAESEEHPLEASLLRTLQLYS